MLCVFFCQGTRFAVYAICARQQANDRMEFGARAEIHSAIRSRETAGSRTIDRRPFAQAAFLDIRKVAVQCVGRTPSEANEKAETDASQTGKNPNSVGSSP